MECLVAPNRTSPTVELVEQFPLLHRFSMLQFGAARYYACVEMDFDIKSVLHAGSNFSFEKASVSALNPCVGTDCSFPDPLLLVLDFTPFRTIAERFLSGIRKVCFGKPWHWAF